MEVAGKGWGIRREGMEEGKDGSGREGLGD